MEAFLSSIRPTYPDALMQQSKEYPGSRMTLIETSFLPAGECICKQFVFIIPLRNAPAVKTEGNLHNLKDSSIFPCNPLQVYRIADSEIDDFKAYIISMDHALFYEIAEALYGSAKLEFQVDCFAFGPELRKLIGSFIRECREGQPGCALMLQSLSVQAAVTILRESRHSLAFKPLNWKKYHDDKGIKRAIDYLTDHYLNRITLTDLANETNYSPCHFLRLFKTHTGRTPFEFLLEYKIEKAKTMLRGTDYSVYQVCDLCGFSSVSYFSQAFKNKTGLSPTQFRKSS